MKKLRLKALELGAADVLTRAQLKNVLGGDEGSGASVPSAKCSCTGGYTFYCQCPATLSCIQSHCANGLGACGGCPS